MTRKQLYEATPHVSAREHRLGMFVELLLYFLCVLPVALLGHTSNFFLFILFCVFVMFALGKVREHFMLYLNDRRSSSKETVREETESDSDPTHKE